MIIDVHQHVCWSDHDFDVPWLPPTDLASASEYWYGSLPQILDKILYANALRLVPLKK